MPRLVTQDPYLGRVVLPPRWDRMISYPTGGRLVSSLREVGIFFARQCRPIYGDDGRLLRMELVWSSLTHNERVNAGASEQAKQCFGGGASPAAPSATVYPSVIAVANATLTKASTDQSLGSASSGVTTNEFTTLGLARAAITAPVAGDYTAPSTLGGQFTQNIAKTFTATGSATAYGGGAFDSTTVAGSILYVEDNFSSNAVLVANDTLKISVSMSN